MSNKTLILIPQNALEALEHISEVIHERVGYDPDDIARAEKLGRQLVRLVKLPDKSLLVDPEELDLLLSITESALVDWERWSDREYFDDTFGEGTYAKEVPRQKVYDLNRLSKYIQTKLKELKEAVA
jgi:hypothetical protein